MKPLTPHQKTMWDMKQAGKTRHEIAEALGISVNNVSKTLTVIRGKMGIKDAAKQAHEARRLENADPERVDILLEALSTPGITRDDAARLAGYKSGEHINQKALNRMLAVYQTPHLEKRRIKSEDIKAMLEDQIARGHRFMTDEKFAEASVRDIGIAQAAWIEKLQLLNGQPTQIISDHERKQINELGAALLTEMRRRGITIDGTARVIKEVADLDQPR